MYNNAITLGIMQHGLLAYTCIKLDNYGVIMKEDIILKEMILRSHQFCPILSHYIDEARESFVKSHAVVWLRK